MIALLAGLVLAGAALAAIPAPPRRPPEFGKPAPAESPSEQNPPAPKGTPAAPAAPAAPQTSPSGRTPIDIDVNQLQPFNLPPASRERMHQCGDEWRKLKMTGQSRGLIWRGFAEKCLAR